MPFKKVTVKNAMKSVRQKNGIQQNDNQKKNLTKRSISTFQSHELTSSSHPIVSQI